jgi:Arc/MetJ family transcription regulator
MSKKLVYIDDDLLERARAAAGTPTIRATVEAGLRRLADAAIVVQHVRRLRRVGTLSRAKLAEARAGRVRLK